MTRNKEPFQTLMGAQHGEKTVTGYIIRAGEQPAVGIYQEVGDKAYTLIHIQSRLGFASCRTLRAALAIAEAMADCLPVGGAPGTKPTTEELVPIRERLLAVSEVEDDRYGQARYGHRVPKHAPQEVAA